MICSALTTLTSSDTRGVRGAHVNSFDQRALHHGASMNELHFCGELSFWELDTMHRGKDASIQNMLAGGNGFPQTYEADCSSVSSIAYNAAATIERRDLRALLAWQNSLQQCKHDRARGATA